MFKLIKILNSGVNVPEPCRLKKDSAAEIKMGAALILNGGNAANCSSTTRPEYIALDDGKIGNDYVMAYAISENMIFEAPVTESPETLTEGVSLTLAKDGDGAAIGVTATTASGVAKIVSLDGAVKLGDTVTVKF